MLDPDDSLDLRLQSPTDTSVTVIWNPIPRAVKYQICYRDTVAGTQTCQEVAAGANNQPFQIRVDGLKPNTKYQFSGRAFFPGRKTVINTQKPR